MYVNFAVEQPGDPAFFCMMQTTNGIDTSNIRYRNLGSLSAQVLVDEEHFGDNEVRHAAAESIGFLVATPGMFHVLATTGDQDADGIADSYELANGLIIGEIDYYKDLDGDGLTNAEEAREGTRADLSDSDGDGVSDYDEVNFLNSDALANDVGTFDLVETIPGSNFFNEFGGWASDESNALQRSTRGSIDYEINVQVSGLYSVEIDVSPNTLASLSKYHDFIISLDGEELSQESVVMESGQTATMRILTPWINPGAHQLKVFVDNSYTFRQIKIEEVRLYSSSGIDSNENQIPDWVELRILNSNKLTKDESDLAMAELPNNGWYASLELSEDELTEATITYESGALSETISVEWVSTNLLAENFMYVRQGDALKLTAYEDEFSDKAYTISIGGSNYTVNSSSSVIHRFNETGPNLIEVYYTNADGLSLTHQVTVEVVSPVILPQVAIVPGYEVDWVVEGIHDNVVIQVDDAIGVYDGERLETGYKYSLGAASAISKTAIARLGYGGPILGKTEIQSMTLRSADETSVFSSRNSDGLFEISMPLVVNNISEDVEIKCEIIKAGVLFEDGSTEAVITSDDLNEFGSYNFKFLMNTLTSNCHRFSVWRDGVRIAYLF